MQEDNSPKILDYAAPSTRKASQIDAIPFVLSIIQTLLAILAVPLSPVNFGITSKYWYEWPAQFWLSPLWQALLFLAGSAIAVDGSWRIGVVRNRRYWIYAIFVLANMVLIELSLLLLSPWLGEARSRWIYLHNMRHEFEDPARRSTFPVFIAMINPALWCIVLRNLHRKFYGQLIFKR